MLKLPEGRTVWVLPEGFRLAGSIKKQSHDAPDDQCSTGDNDENAHRTI